MRHEYQDGDIVRFNDGRDEYPVRGMAKTQPKVIIEVDGEAVYVPVSCVTLVRSRMSNSEKVAFAIKAIESILKDRVQIYDRLVRLQRLLEEE